FDLVHVDVLDLVNDGTHDHLHVDLVLHYPRPPDDLGADVDVHHHRVVDLHLRVRPRLDVDVHLLVDFHAIDDFHHAPTVQSAAVDLGQPEAAEEGSLDGHPEGPRGAGRRGLGRRRSAAVGRRSRRPEDRRAVHLLHGASATLDEAGSDGVQILGHASNGLSATQRHENQCEPKGPRHLQVLRAADRSDGDGRIGTEARSHHRQPLLARERAALGSPAGEERPVRLPVALRAVFRGQPRTYRGGSISGTMPAMRRLCVFCGSSTGSRAAYADAARALGGALARRGLGLVYGGGSIGLMGVVADAVLAGGGTAIGIIPRGLYSAEIAHAGLSELRVVSGMHERKETMATLADGFIALPGGLGTFEELLE